MKRTFIIILLALLLVVSIAVTVMVFFVSRSTEDAGPPLPPGAYVVAVCAFDVETSVRVPVKVLVRVPAEGPGQLVPMQGLAWQCEPHPMRFVYVDTQPRTILVTSDGYEPRTFKVDGETELRVALRCVEELDAPRDGLESPSHGEESPSESRTGFPARPVQS
ncbi:MAG: hypothetical protein JXR37_29505 [Kiritimatiellae bacterium]|nr:hypothetical protein [Kiritimatiellia bacterium]